MNRDFRLVYDYNFKFSLLLCTILNYYRKRYATNQLNSKILVLGSSKKELIKLYDRLFINIRYFNKRDLSILKQFMRTRDKFENELYNKIIMKGVDSEELLNGIEKEYANEDKAIFIDPKQNNLKDIPIECNIIFMEFDKAKYLKDKHLIKEIFVVEQIESNTPICRLLCNVVEDFIKETTKSKKVLQSNNINEDELSKLSIFINSESSGIDIWDTILDDLKDDFVDE